MAMDHASCKERLLDLQYGELSPREAAEVERHLAECTACRAERDRMAATSSAMRQLEPLPAPTRGDPVLLAAARAAAQERRRDSFGLALRAFSLRVAVGTAFAVAAVFLLVNVKHRKPAGPPPAEIAMAPVQAAPEAARAPEPEVTRNAAPEKAQTALAQRDEARAAAPARMKRESAPGPERRASGGGPAIASADSPRYAQAPPAERQAEERAAESKGELARRAEPEALALRDRAAKKAARADAEAPPSVAVAGAPAPPPAAAAPRAPALAMSDSARAGARPGGSAAAPGALGAGLAGPFAREIDRRVAAGELSDARRSFAPCPGGDVRRTAWFDREQQIVKLLRERADGAVVEEWFDGSGRLREALVRGGDAGRSWARHVTVSERGEQQVQDLSSSGLAPEAPPPALVRRDPTGAFFAGPGCEGSGAGR